MSIELSHRLDLLTQRVDTLIDRVKRLETENAVLRDKVVVHEVAVRGILDGEREGE